MVFQLEQFIDDKKTVAKNAKRLKSIKKSISFVFKKLPDILEEKGFIVDKDTDRLMITTSASSYNFEAFRSDLNKIIEDSKCKIDIYDVVEVVVFDKSVSIHIK